MENEIYLLALKLNSALKRDQDFVHLNELEKKLENDNDVIKLSYKKDMACVKYNDLLKIYPEDNVEVKAALKELNKAKIELDSNELVREYLSAYSKVKQTIFEMNNILFSDFKSKECI